MDRDRPSSHRHERSPGRGAQPVSAAQIVCAYSKLLLIGCRSSAWPSDYCMVRAKAAEHFQQVSGKPAPSKSMEITYEVVLHHSRKRTRSIADKHLRLVCAHLLGLP